VSGSDTFGCLIHG